MTAPWAVLLHELIFTPLERQPLPSHGLQWQQHFISRQLRARLYKCTRTRTKVSSKQLLRFKSTLIPSASLTRVGTLEQGSACCGREPCARTSLLRRPVVETVYRKGKSSVGSLRYQWKCILRATAGSRGGFFIFLFLSPLQGKAGVKGTYTRNISRKGWLKQLQSYSKRCSKAGNKMFCARSNPW